MPGRTKLYVQIAVALIVLIAVTAGALVLVKDNLRRQEIPTQEAERLIRLSEFMRQTSTTRLVLSRNLLFPPSDLTAEHPEVTPFMNLGLVTMRPAQVVFGHPVGAEFVLTPEGERAAASSGWKRITGPGGEEGWMIPTAWKELLGVQPPLKISRDVSETRFAWKWKPSKVGKALGAPDTTETSHVRFFRQENGWFLDEESIR